MAEIEDGGSRHLGNLYSLIVIIVATNLEILDDGSRNVENRL